jgi:Flp pilus assembly protein protease CpaA
MTWFFLPAAVWVFACGVCDYRRRRIPNILMFFGWAGASALVVHQSLKGESLGALQAAITLAVWGLAILFWLQGWWGAGDAKFVMALALAFPDLWMFLAMFLGNLAAGVTAARAAREDGQLGHRQRTLPAVTVLGLGWLAWAAALLVKG